MGHISVDHFSLEQQLGNKTKVNRYHLPLVHGATWCGDINVWNDYAIFHNDVIQGRRSGNGYLKYVMCTLSVSTVAYKQLLSYVNFVYITQFH